MNKNCTQCNKKLLDQKRTFCSLVCYWVSSKENPNRGTFQKGNKAATGHIGLRGSECHLWKGGEITLNCKACSMDFKVLPYRKDTAKTCSLTCYNEMRKTPGFRLALSEIQRKLVEEKLGDMRSIITSLDKIIRKSSQYKMWRETIFKRDKYTCQFCRVSGGILRADHIKQFALILVENDVQTFEDALKCVQLWDIENGRTLCEICHIKTPTYGRKTVTIKQSCKR